MWPLVFSSFAMPLCFLVISSSDLCHRHYYYCQELLEHQSGGLASFASIVQFLFDLATHNTFTHFSSKNYSYYSSKVDMNFIHVQWMLCLLHQNCDVSIMPCILSSSICLIPFPQPNDYEGSKTLVWSHTLYLSWCFT